MSGNRPWGCRASTYYHRPSTVRRQSAMSAACPSPLGPPDREPPVQSGYPLYPRMGEKGIPHALHSDSLSISALARRAQAVSASAGVVPFALTATSPLPCRHSPPALRRYCHNSNEANGSGSRLCRPDRSIVHPAGTNCIAASRGAEKPGPSSTDGFPKPSPIASSAHRMTG